LQPVGCSHCMSASAPDKCDTQLSFKSRVNSKLHYKIRLTHRHNTTTAPTDRRYVCGRCTLPRALTTHRQSAMLEAMHVLPWQRPTGDSHNSTCCRPADCSMGALHKARGCALST
jgi:hypothetical protein